MTLFIVPWLAAGSRSGSACASAPSTTSVMRCDASTLPPATADGRTALTIVPAGAITSTTRPMPAL